MRKLITLLSVLFTLSVSAQTDTIIKYDSLKVFRIDTSVVYSDTSVAPNYLWANYHFISGNDSLYQSQFIMHDSLDNKLLPTLMDSTWSSSGTVLRIKLDSTQILWTPEQLRDSLILPSLKLIYGNSNVTKL